MPKTNKTSDEEKQRKKDTISKIEVTNMQELPRTQVNLGYVKKINYDINVKSGETNDK